MSEKKGIYMSKSIQPGKNRSILQLSRLETLTDVLYAIVIWNFFVLIPDPAGNWPWDSVVSFLIANWLILVFVIIGILISIIYWAQSNRLLGLLERTDGIHSGFMFFQLLFLLMFLYSMHLGIVKGGSVGTRAFESLAVTLMGLSSSLGWYRAVKDRRLVLPEVSDKQIREETTQVLVELISPIITIPFAFAGPIYWEISWLGFIPLSYLLKRYRRM